MRPFLSLVFVREVSKTSKKLKPVRLRRKSVTNAVVLGVIFIGRLSSLTVLGVSIFSSAAAAVLNPKRPFGIKGGPVGPGPKTLGLGTRPQRVRGRFAAGF